MGPSFVPRMGRVGPSFVPRMGRVGPSFVPRMGRVGPSFVPRMGRVGPSFVSRGWGEWDHHLYLGDGASVEASSYRGWGSGNNIPVFAPSYLEYSHLHKRTVFLYDKGSLWNQTLQTVAVPGIPLSFTAHRLLAPQTHTRKKLRRAESDIVARSKCI